MLSSIIYCKSTARRTLFLTIPHAELDWSWKFVAVRCLFTHGLSRCLPSWLITTDSRLSFKLCAQHWHKKTTWRTLGRCVLWFIATWELLWQLWDSAVSQTIHKIYEHHSETWTFNDTVLQAPFSSVCGHYCVYFLLHKSRDFTTSEIVSRFSKNLFENDRSVAQFVLNL